MDSYLMNKDTATQRLVAMWALIFCCSTFA